MWRNYLLTAWRALRRTPLYTVINVGGLALGLACCILLVLFVENEWTYDQFHADADRIYRINRTVAEANGGVSESGTTPVPLARALAASDPAVASVTQTKGGSSTPVLRDNMRFNVAVRYADSSFTDVFSFPTRAGVPSAALARPDGAVLTTDAAERLFGTTDVVGRALTVVYDEQANAEVTVRALVEAPPTNSSFQFELLLPMELHQRTYGNALIWQILSTTWNSGIVTTFLKAQPTASPSAIEDRVNALLIERVGEDGLMSDQSTRSAWLQPLADIHFAPGVDSPLPTRDPMSIYVLAALAGLILLIACVNFTTLSLGQSMRRLHEVGVRKAIGAQVGQIRAQFWGEALLVCALAAGLGLGLARLALPTFSALAQESLTFALFDRPWRLAAIGALVLGTGLVAGGYPSLLLARLTPSTVLRGSSSVRLGQRATRALMVVQFALSVAFLSGALVTDRQLDYMRSKSMGFDTERVVTFQASNVSPNQQSGNTITLGFGSTFTTLKERARRLPEVESITAFKSPLATRDASNYSMSVEHPDGSSVSAAVNAVDTSFVRTMGIDVRAGRGVPRAGEPATVVVNEAFVAAMGWDDPVGRTLPSGDGMMGRVLDNARVGGVVQNFHFRTLHHPIEPLILISSNTLTSGKLHVAVRLNPGPIQPALDALRATWSEIVPDATLDYTFLDDRIDAQYAEEARWQQITTWASTLALLIACAGLFGLATLAAQRRQREIGIRKALGASVTRILGLISKDFLLLVGIGFVIAVPLAYWALSAWLQQFAYRVDLTGTWFGVAGLLTIAVAAVAVGTQAYRAARTDPADVLRAE
jgi:putative ABC transport system permease protein